MYFMHVLRRNLELCKDEGGHLQNKKFRRSYQRWSGIFGAGSKEKAVNIKVESAACVVHQPSS
jgi:hypothetical protein